MLWITYGKKSGSVTTLITAFSFPYGKANIWLVEIRGFLLPKSRTGLERMVLSRAQTYGQML